MRRAGHHLLLPCIGEPAAASRVSPGSSGARSEASGAAADIEPEPDVEASAGRSTQILLAMAAMGERGRHYGRRRASSYGSCPRWSAGLLTHHSPASPSPCIGWGGDYREPHCSDDVSSSVTPRLEEEQGRLATRADFMKPSVTPQNIRPQTPRHPSLMDRRARHWNFESDGTFEGRNHSTHFMKPSAMPRNIRLQIPRRPSVLDRRDNYHLRVGASDGINGWRLPKGILTAGCLRQFSSTASSSNKSAIVPLGKDQAASAGSAHSSGLPHQVVASQQNFKKIQQ